MMTPPFALLESLMNALSADLASPDLSRRRSLVGFDGFVDYICRPCDKRVDATTAMPMSEIKQLGERIIAASGKSCNIELLSKEVKLGGNAPIMANALLELGQEVLFIGSIGEGQVEEIFQSMAARCQKVISLAASGHTDALEFNDGKILLGKLDHLKNVNYQTLLKAISVEELIEWFSDLDLFACCNWTMLYGLEDIWQGLLQDVLPHLSQQKKPWMFLDLADPAKRMDGDIQKALQLFEQFSPYFQLSLGLNAAEALRLYQLACQKPGEQKSQEEIAQVLSRHFKIDHLVIHTRQLVTVATQMECVSITVPYCAKPVLATGAGDNFNAGYTLGLLLKKKPSECLLLAIAVSGFYVRNGKSPTAAQMLSFLKMWHANEL